MAMTATPAGTRSYQYAVDTQLVAADFDEVNGWCRANLGIRGTSQYNQNGQWWTMLRRDDFVDRAASPYRITILTRTAEHHMLASLRWA